MLVFTSLLSCKKEKIDDEIEVEVDKTWSTMINMGGTYTVNNQSDNAFSITPFGFNRYGCSWTLVLVIHFFKTNWVASPASTKAVDGLGPTFNARSCSSCHFKDGRGRPPMNLTDLSKGLLFRLHAPGKNNNGGPIGDPNYGGQLQDRAITGVEAEGRNGDFLSRDFRDLS